jgi:hypothetical protein
MDHQREKYGADGIALGEELVRTIHAWADKNGNQTVAAVPLIAIREALIRFLQVVPPEKRRAYLDNFIRSAEHALSEMAH